MSAVRKTTDAEGRKKKPKKQGTQARDPRGIPVMVIGPTGKRRMEWQ